MIIRTHKIGDIKMDIVATETYKRHIALTQGKDVIILSMDQAREISAVIEEAWRWLE